MSAGREARRRADRAMRAAGVAAVARTTIPAHLVTTETITAGVEHVLELLVVERADITGHLAITIGSDHPNFPGVTVVEAKAARRLASARENEANAASLEAAIAEAEQEARDDMYSEHGDCSDPRCPLDHSLDRLDG